ncbi:MAG: HIT family protein [Sulfurospirillum sp.]|nr:MAG: HIT family protein [Sulfurospirillum sp.]
MSKRVYEDEYLYIDVHDSKIPWFKVFTKEPYREFSEVPFKVKLQLLAKLDILEREMLSFFNPTKINIASFGNELPQVHFHIMARFKDDSHFPNPMWGEKLRDGCEHSSKLDEFISLVKPKLEPIELEEDDD